MIRLQVDNFTILFEIKDDTALVTGYSGSGAKLHIPEKIFDNDKEYMVAGIGKKAFLGCNGLRDVFIPESVSSLDDWCFSQCRHLTKIQVGTGVSFGKNVFEGSNRIEEIYFGECTTGLARLVAAAVNGLPSAFLLRDSDVGSVEWYSRWDLSLKAFLEQDDIEGYSDTALCGEEDISYDGIGSVDGELLGEDASYLRKIGKNKCRLVLLRLMFKDNLSDSMNEFLENYIKRHSLGNGNGAAWLTIKEDYGDNLDFLKLYTDIVKPDDQGIDSMISDMGSDMAQSKAFLIRMNKKENKADAFFDMLTL